MIEPNTQAFVNNLTEEQRRALLDCKTREELEKVIDNYDIDLPDEMLEGVTGGKGFVPFLLAGFMTFSGAAAMTVPIQASAEVSVSQENTSSVVYGTDITKGMTIDRNGSAYEVIEVQHVKPGKGAAYARIKIQDIARGTVYEKAIGYAEKINIALVDHVDINYSYSDGEYSAFIRLDNYEFLPISNSFLPKGFKFIKEDTACKALFYRGEIIKVELPEFVRLRVTETDMSVMTRNGNGTKQALLETGAVITVPSSIEKGDYVSVNTKTCDFAKKL